MIALNGSCPIESGFIGGLADNECKHGRLPTDNTAPCGCWPHQEYYRDPSVHEDAVRRALGFPLQEAILPTEATPEAPFGYKADGTPRKRPAADWLSDPNKVAAAAAKRRKTRSKAATPVVSNGHAPALSKQEAGDLLARIGGEFDERLMQIDAGRAQLREQLARLDAAHERLALGRQAIKQGQALEV
jgi:hypothetical protein